MATDAEKAAAVRKLVMAGVTDPKNATEFIRRADDRGVPDLNLWAGYLIQLRDYYERGIGSRVGAS